MLKKYEKTKEQENVIHLILLHSLLFVSQVTHVLLPKILKKLNKLKTEFLSQNYKFEPFIKYHTLG